MVRKCASCGMNNRDTAKFCSNCGSRNLVPVTALGTGAVVKGRHRVVSVLGQGGMGAVYLVEDQQLFGKRWALKEMLDTFMDPNERAQAVQQFEREARLLVALSHPHLPHIVDYFQEGGRQYLVMEYVEGQTLETVLQKTSGFLAESQVVGWALQVCDVLEYLHGQTPPIIFRDLKPDNIMVDRTDRVKLIDFGIARLFDPAKKTDTLKMGTVGYAPPEGYAGRGQTDARSDVYALGATMHHLLTRHDPTANPFVFPNSQTLNKAVSAATAGAIAKATSYDVTQRFQSITDMKQALRGSATTGGAATSTAQSAVSSDPSKPTPVQIVQEFPDPIFKMTCPKEGQETMWSVEVDSDQVRCLSCDYRIGTSYISLNQIKGVIEAFCSACKKRTSWLVWEYTPYYSTNRYFVCLECGTTREKQV